ncbi:hypothetical protein [Bacillus cereus group sp. Bc002]|uniref:hypothetical protein n=1 Tax=Bacillus cereus group sp. Bc002 TaxID=3018130 RepID=UPI0022E47642|nr:hypothetical protein [Bacillus cereus group sp. Bc002]
MGAAARLKAVVLCKPAPGPPVAPVAPVGPVGPVFPLEPLGRLPSQLKQLRGYMHVLLSIF